METRNLLLDSVASIKQLNPEQAGSDAAATAFNSFRRGVVHASSGRTGPPESLLGDLEPKSHVLKFLVGVYMHRRILRKQVGAVLAELLHVDAWLDTLRKDKALCAQLPDDLASLLAEREEEEKEDAVVVVSEPTSPVRDEQRSEPNASVQSPSRPSRSPWDAPAKAKPAQKPPEERNGSSRPKLSQVRSVISKAAANDGIALPIRVAAPSLTGHYEGGNIRLTKNEHDAVCDLLEKGKKQMEALDFSAAERDIAISAFETFRRAVQQVVNSSLSKQDDNVLDRLEPKGRILEFLVDMYELHQKYRSRVTSTLMRLLNFDGWRYAAESDDSVKAAVADFQDMRALGTVNSVGVVSLNLKSAAANAVARGGVGALYVQIIAGYNLLIADSNGTSDPYVRVRLGGRTQRTHVINDCLNPKWDANPFIFEVSSLDAILKLDCLDCDAFKDDPLGDLEIPVAQAPLDSESSVMRCSLNNAPHGELEFKLLYLPGKGSQQVPELVMHEQTAQDPCAQNCEDHNEQVTSDDQILQPSAKLWTPWGAIPTEVSSSQTEAKPISARVESRPRASLNPFESDSAVQQANPFQSDQSAQQNGYPAVTEGRKVPPSILTSGQRPGSEGDLPKGETSPSTARTAAAVKTPTSSGTWTPSAMQAFKQTNPFEARPVPQVGTNPFEVDPSPAVKELDPRSLSSRNPFLNDLQVPTQ